MEEDSLRGVTSNPAIFEKAILGSTDYDDEIERLAGEGHGPREIYEELAIRDVQLAAEVLRPVYDEAGGADGFVSLEVEPALAHDTEGTIEQARDLWKRVDAPNVMIKIPGHRRRAAGHRAGDLRGDQRERDPSVLGRVLRAGGRGVHQGLRESARATTRTRWRASSSRASTPRWTSASRTTVRCAEPPPSPTPGRPTRGSRRSSTATASPSCASGAARCSGRCGPRRASRTPPYPETKYVDELVAPDTVNTMPMPTLLAAAEKTEVRGATADQDPTDGAGGARRRRHRHERRDRQAAARRHRRLRHAVRRC